MPGARRAEQHQRAGGLEARGVVGQVGEAQRERDDRRHGHLTAGHADGRRAGQLVLEEHRADRVAEAGRQDHEAADELVAAAREVEPEEQDDPEHADDDPDRGPALRALVVVEAAARAAR